MDDKIIDLYKSLDHIDKINDPDELKAIIFLLKKENQNLCQRNISLTQKYIDYERSIIPLKTKFEHVKSELKRLLDNLNM